MRALSLMQPWAALVMAGIKTIDCRSWQESHDFRERDGNSRIAIHASGNFDSRHGLDLDNYQAHNGALELTQSAILGTISLDDIRPGRRSDLNLALCDTVGALALVLSRPLPVRPIPCKGAPFFWFIPERELRQLEMALTRPPVPSRRPVVPTGRPVVPTGRPVAMPEVLRNLPKRPPGR